MTNAKHVRKILDVFQLLGSKSILTILFIQSGGFKIEVIAIVNK